MQPAEIDALLEIHLRVAGRLQRAMPLVIRVDVVGHALTFGSTSCDLPPFLMGTAFAAALVDLAPPPSPFSSPLSSSVE